MLISRNWLKKYVKLADTASANDIASKLTESTVEVEGYEDKGKSLENVVVGKVVQVEKHPQADKLVVCNVDIGSERVVIVCGGSNVVKGMLVAVAKVGALVAWHGEGDLVRLKPTEIRGIESHGMICSSDEIGLAELFPKKQEKEILDLTFLKIKPGVPVAVALGLQDIIFEIDNKSLSNRPDLWGHYGIAREVAALYAREVLPYTTKEIKEGKEEYLKVKVQEQQWCSRYSAIIIDGITITDSPEWLKKSLLAVGIQPINNIVDITNFIMLDIGQPMHAFDASSLASAAIVVRKAFDQEKFTTLDGKEYVLNTDMLVVADEHKPLALAGVMGGLDSAIKPGTTKVIFESACFNAGMVRKTSTLLGLRTDASMRFEKNLDPTMCEIALKKAVELVVTTCVGARVVSKVVDVYPKPLRQPVFKIEHAMFAKKIGVDIPLKTIQVILKRLGFTVEEKNKLLSITVPTWRATKDISLAEDIVEEIVRMYGYQAIPGVLPSLPMMPPQENRLRSLEHRVRDSAVVGENYTEVYNYSFVSQDQIHALQDDQTLYLELDNPLSKEKPYLRRNVLISLLDTVEKNSVEEELRLFEIGKNYITEEVGARVHINSDELLPRQDVLFCAVYKHKKKQVPFWEAKTLLTRIMGELKCAYQLTIPQALKPWQHPLRTAEVHCQEKIIGSVFEIHPLVLEKYGIEGAVSVVELNLSSMEQMMYKISMVTTYQPVSEYPEMMRDIALMVKEEVSHQNLQEVLMKQDPLIKSVQLFDVYIGAPIKSGYKSMAYRITYSRHDRTLTTQEVDEVQSKIHAVLKKEFDAELRS